MPSKPPAIDLFEIDLKSGKNWLALGKEMARDKIRQRVRAKHRARYLAQRPVRQIDDADVDFTKGEGGRFTGSIGHGGGQSHSQPTLQHDPQLSAHYSVHAHLRNGVIHTSNVYDATRALYEGRQVRLKQPKQVATLVEHLANVSKRMTELGQQPPNFDLCHVAVRGTNLFCADTKGIPRIQMPQMGDDKETHAFEQHLVNKGYKVEVGTELASHLRATQNQLVGAKVGGIARAMAAHPERAGRRIVVSRDNYILDGHHTWAALLAVDAKNNKLGDKKMKIWRVDIDIISLLKEADAFTGGKGHVGVGASQQKDEAALAVNNASH